MIVPLVTDGKHIPVADNVYTVGAVTIVMLVVVVLEQVPLLKL